MEVKSIGKIMNNIIYSYWLATACAVFATKTTEYVLLGINFVVDMKLCYTAIRLHRKVTDDAMNTNAIQKMKEEV